MVAKELLPPGAVAVDREALADLDPAEPAFLLANGWYLHSFQKFPPPENIIPFYISVHVADSRLLLERKAREHFRKFSPIGCRDQKTLQLFLGWGIPAYYSSCLTLLAKNRASPLDLKNDEALLVDNLDHAVPDTVKAKLEKLIAKPLVRVSHNPPEQKGDFKSYCENAEKYMDSLLKRYCKAALVVTSKIHCALPCLGMGAKVLMIHPTPRDPRLATVREFMDVVSYNEVLSADQLTLPEVRQKQLSFRKAFLSHLLEESIRVKDNAVRRLNKYEFLTMKGRSVLFAWVFRAGVLILRTLGIAREKIMRVYGS